MPKIEKDLSFASFIIREKRQYIESLTRVLAEQNCSSEIPPSFYSREKAQGYWLSNASQKCFRGWIQDKV